jgi:Tol biopolymer transport system component
MNPTWSPDGSAGESGGWISLVQVVEGVYQVVLLRSDGSEIRQVFEWAAFPVVTWSQDGLHLAIEASPAEDQPSASLFLLSLQDGALRQVLTEDEPGSYELRYPSFRP